MLDSWPPRLAQWLANEALVLVTVAASEGSAPREAGACMLVARERIHASIGGGHLEWQAMALARQMLAAGDGPPSCLRRFALGANLGQCCGGVVWLLFERIGPEQAGPWRKRVEQWASGLHWQRRCRVGEASRWQVVAAAQPGRCRLRRAEGSAEFEQVIAQGLMPVTLFGAGHVGVAIARALAPLPVQLCWVDGRDTPFAAAQERTLPPLILSDAPELAVDAAPPASYFLVLTHSHALDLALCERILRREDFAYFGLIGSRSKRSRFEHRLLARGVAPERLSEMSCPIGLAGIRDKSPAVIAAAVAAQLLLVREAAQVVQRAAKVGRVRS